MYNEYMDNLFERRPPQPPRPPFPPQPPFPPYPPMPPQPQPPYPPQPGPYPPMPMPSPKVGDIYLYTVNRGDNLYEVARKFKTSVELIRDMNNLGRNPMIYSGQKLLIPVLYKNMPPMRSEEDVEVAAPIKQEPKQSYELYF